MKEITFQERNLINFSKNRYLIGSKSMPLSCIARQINHSSYSSKNFVISEAMNKLSAWFAPAPASTGRSVKKAT